MAEVYQLNRARRMFRDPPKFDLPEPLQRVGRVFGLHMPTSFDSYCLQRRRSGVNVYLVSQGTLVNLSLVTSTEPRNFAEARLIVAAVAERYGWALREVPMT